MGRHVPNINELFSGRGPCHRSASRPKLHSECFVHSSNMPCSGGVLLEVGQMDIVDMFGWKPDIQLMLSDIGQKSWFSCCYCNVSAEIDRR